MSLYNISGMFQSLNITLVLWLEKWVYGHWIELLQNKLWCEFSLVSSVYSHLLQDKYKVVHPILRRAEEFLANYNAFIAGSTVAHKEIPRGTCVLDM